MKYLFKENNNKIKSNKVLDSYKKLLNETNNRSRGIMLLVPNATVKLKYERALNIDISEELNINTYIGFIKKEIIKFWPLITEQCNKIINKSISPRFIPSSLSEYMIINKVNDQRNANGYFQDITGTNRSISNSIINNINKAALALIYFQDIGEKIYLSKKNKDSIMRFSYSQMDEIIDYYISKLLENSMIDNAITIYLYTNYLINDERYIKYLSQEIKYLIVDSLECCSNAEVDFINLLSNYTLDTYIYFNKTNDYSVFYNIDMEYIYENIINKIEDNSNSINSIKEIDNINLSDIYLLPAEVKLNESSQLYSEMIDEVTSKVIELVNNGISLKDIAIISPINNTILDYQIKNILNRNKINVFNTKKNNKIIDYPYSNALVVATCIFYGYEDYIKEDEYISFIEILFNVNRIQAYKIYRNKEEEDNGYKNLEQYIISKRSEKLKITEFLIKFYIDKMLNLKEGIKNVDVCKNIIYESEAFIENIKLLGINNNKEEERVFIEVLKTTINDYYRISDIADLKESNSIILTTPYSYISYDINRPIQIWVDIGSNAWSMKIEKDISNLIVLRKSFKEKQIYTNEMEEYYKKYYLYNLIYNLLINAKEVYAYKSEYTVNGYIQESILYSILLKLVSKGDV
ncbi:hypothetical protein [Romboutsia ilealis]|uniref:hypothetical protein n=1 Tax=Romboutsia ilealis TaxID=1115758 RepID=UPI002572823A|nr:hypothetical protein [Romboutsia ilealis]